MAVVEATFRSMGLRTEKSVATHLLLENAFESNLLSDISQADYLANHQGHTHPQPLEGLSVFVDDVYVFGYLRREDCVVYKGRLSCTTGENGAAKRVVARISSAVQDSIGRDRKYMQTNILHTLAIQGDRGGAIQETISRIEYDTDKKAQKAWREQHPGIEPAGLFVATVDESEVPMSELQAALPAFESQLLAQGYGLYSIDYTQDFSGTLDRKALVDYLCTNEGFREQGGLAEAMRRRGAPTILANTDRVGEHVCTRVRTSAADTPHVRSYTTRWCRTSKPERSESRLGDI